MVATIILRALQLIFSGVVLGLSVYLAHNYGYGHAVAQLRYGAFCGALGLLVSFVGIAAAFLDVLQGMVMSVVDALAALLLLAGGIPPDFPTRVVLPSVDEGLAIPEAPGVTMPHGAS
ncbi:hypothetical protein BP6252_01660 [Coleophoma cylindrospora]|uniref:MARVEL domain-containing protein n=1 Tax=Coleophoma cylindrospora TaxID=1849047 RepID=A0A3D8SV16_9HELO|nr:hypothetical protein BP6252_01660 [Coleophoma cylindrospora]